MSKGEEMTSVNHEIWNASHTGVLEVLREGESGAVVSMRNLSELRIAPKEAVELGEWLLATFKDDE